MQHLPRLCAVLLLAGLIASPFAVSADRSERLSGEYIWTAGGSRGPLEASFTATGPDAWDVAFYFTFDGQDHTYEGTGQGSLSEGPFEGRVRTESGRRTFTFEGTFREGRFEGTHAEVRRGTERRLGSLTLAVESAES